MRLSLYCRDQGGTFNAMAGIVGFGAISRNRVTRSILLLSVAHSKGVTGISSFKSNIMPVSAGTWSWWRMRIFKFMLPLMICDTRLLLCPVFNAAARASFKCFALGRLWVAGLDLL